MREQRPEVSPEQMEQRRAFAKTVLRNFGFSHGTEVPKGPRRETVTDDDKAEIEALLAQKAGTA